MRFGPGRSPTARRRVMLFSQPVSTMPSAAHMVESMPHSPYAMQKNPLSPQPAPQLFLQIQNPPASL